MSLRPALALVFGLAAGSAAAQDAVEAPGMLTDYDFYQLVSCGAPMSEVCREPVVRWRLDGVVRVALRRIDRAYLGRKKLRAEAALTRAVQALNGAGAGVRLVHVGPGVPAEIELYFLDLDAGDVIAGTGIEGVDGAELGVTSTRLIVDGTSDAIRRAAIVVSTTLETAGYEGELLTQLTRAMGLMVPVAGPAYEGLSVLSAGDHSRTTLGLQDIAALRQHYAAPEPPPPPVPAGN
ncbi:MAG: hypothetical protein KDK10_04750 [Maritimibacter sp.]|nr:hypothetical protein [Maritimibacter sp.]